MFDALGEKLEGVFKRLRGQGTITEKNIRDAMREIRMALLEADVHFKVVKQLIANIKEKAMGEDVLTSLSPAQQVVKIVRDELVKILGSHHSRLRFANDPPMRSRAAPTHSAITASATPVAATSSSRTMVRRA